MPTLVAFALGLVLTPALAGLGRRVGLVDRPSPDVLKIHAEEKPLTGGIAVIAAVLVALAMAGDGLEPMAVASVLLLLSLGVVDDLVTLPPQVRLAVELAAGGLLASAGATFAPLGAAGPVAVVFAVPAVANAVNLMDGQDGLAGGTAAVAALGLAFVGVASGGVGSAGFAVAAALLAFLVWNRPPARVFLGDGGAYAVGGLLVVLAAASATSWEALLGAAACLLVFGLELASTMVRRAFRRASLVSGDRDHVYDLLALRLLSRERATAAMVAAGLAAAGIAWAVVELPLAAGVVIVVTSVAASAVGVWALWRANGVRLRRSR